MISSSFHRCVPPWRTSCCRKSSVRSAGRREESVGNREDHVPRGSEEPVFLRFVLGRTPSLLDCLRIEQPFPPRRGEGGGGYESWDRVARRSDPHVVLGNGVADKRFGEANDSHGACEGRVALR